MGEIAEVLKLRKQGWTFDGQYFEHWADVRSAYYHSTGSLDGIRNTKRIQWADDPDTEEEA